ncbi:MAG TPA: PHD finger domain-containing protein [Methanofastidiosum sp.]|nr:PHD finger domain-containing protein [Methanofastidiosum sp.]HNU61386.1 PHD finger domain-containing protein [Methanofastidiosum sp.]HOI76567.1 PHD finger domain-containing protein [Methanofastidiosum sp.]
METCGICSKRIKDNLEMCYCSYCNMTFHFTCIDEQPCPNCDRVLNIAHVRLGKPAEIFRKDENKDVYIEEVDIEQKSDEPMSPVEESFEKQGITEEDIPERMKGDFYPEDSSQPRDVPPMSPMVERGRTLRRREMPKKRMSIPKKKLFFIVLVIVLLIINAVVIFYVLNDGNIPFLNIKIGGGEATSNIFLNF